MLKANKSPLFESIFSLYNRNLLKRRFHSLRISGLDFLFNKNHHLPLIIYCNHSSWWDGLIAFQISRLGSLESYMVMEEKQLKDLFLFRKLGAFSIVRENAREAFRSLQYAADLLRTNPGATLWIFPQGEILPNDRRPLQFYHGVSKLIEMIGPCAAVSIAMRYEFLGQFKPEIFVRIDEPEIFESEHQLPPRKDLTLRLSARLTKNLDRLKSDIVDVKIDDYRSVL